MDRGILLKTNLYRGFANARSGVGLGQKPVVARLRAKDVVGAVKSHGDGETRALSATYCTRDFLLQIPNTHLKV